jgi:DNA-binding CsgD family transcriptional regulator
VLTRKLARQLDVAEQLPKMRRGPYAASRHNPLGLTQHEQQVLVLIAEGKSNKEIARSLSRSPRTIEHQVSAVLSAPAWRTVALVDRQRAPSPRKLGAGRQNMGMRTDVGGYRRAYAGQAVMS